MTNGGFILRRTAMKMTEVSWKLLLFLLSLLLLLFLLLWLWLWLLCLWLWLWLLCLLLWLWLLWLWLLLLMMIMMSLFHCFLLVFLWKVNGHIVSLSSSHFYITLPHRKPAADTFTHTQTTIHDHVSACKYNICSYIFIDTLRVQSILNAIFFGPFSFGSRGSLNWHPSATRTLGHWAARRGRSRPGQA